MWKRLRLHLARRNVLRCLHMVQLKIVTEMLAVTEHKRDVKKGRNPPSREMTAPRISVEEDLLRCPALI